MTDKHPAIVTVTHARLRAQQGDPAGAREVLEEILLREPGNEEAADLLRTLPGRRTVAVRPENARRVEPAVTATPDDLAGDFRSALGSGTTPERRKILRLREMLHRIARMREEDHA